jgi:hypothetical protein
MLPSGNAQVLGSGVVMAAIRLCCRSIALGFYFNTQVCSSVVTFVDCLRDE